MHGLRACCVLQGVGIKHLSMAQLDVLEELHHAALSGIAARRMDLVGCWCIASLRIPTLMASSAHSAVRRLPVQPPCVPYCTGGLHSV